MREGRVVGLKCRSGGAVERGKGKKKQKKRKKEKIEEDVWKKKKDKRIK
jgi:hypothetical protein